MSSTVHSRTGSHANARQQRENPKSPQCAVHLRRICGVCLFFEGNIILTDARCGKLGGRRRGKSSAQDCAFWTRKNGGAG